MLILVVSHSVKFVSVVTSPLKIEHAAASSSSSLAVNTISRMSFFTSFAVMILCAVPLSLAIQSSKAFAFNQFGNLNERNVVENYDPEMTKLFDDDTESKVVVPNPLPRADLRHPRDECCVRQRKLVDIGLDITGNSHYVDVGHCRHVCGTGILSVETGRERARQQAWRSSVCKAKSSRLEKFYLLHGVNDVQVIEECESVARPQSCSRLPDVVVLFPDTPHEREVDVGHCRGPCGHGLSCKPLRNRTVTVSGPNGFVCVNAIEECSCEGGCYRAQYRDVFVDSSWNETLNETQEVTKDLDVGVCVGQCARFGNDSFQCVLRDSREPSRCLMSLKKRRSECVPTSFETHVVTKRDGTPKTILSVTECGCE